MKASRATEFVWRVERRLRRGPVLSLSVLVLAGLLAWVGTTGFGPATATGTAASAAPATAAGGAARAGNVATATKPGSTRAGAAVLEATEFRLVNDEGELRGRLAPEDGDPVFQLLGSNGTRTVTVRTSEVATEMILEHEAGVQDARVYVDTAGAGFDLYGAGYSQVYARVRPWEGFSLTATDAMGVPELQVFRDEDGTLRARLSGRVWPDPGPGDDPRQGGIPR